MKPHIQLLIKPDIDIDLFLRTTKQAIGLNPSTSIDRGTKKFSEYEKFIAMLSSFHSEQAAQRPAEAIRRGASLYAHLNFGFMFGCTQRTILKSAERTRLSHTITEQLDEMVLALVSGDLGAWIDATIECTTEDQDFNLRLLYDKVFLAFRKLKLTEFWWDTVTAKHDDGTFRIEAK